MKRGKEGIISGGEELEGAKKAPSGGTRRKVEAELEFEDPFEDEFEKEEVVDGDGDTEMHESNKVGVANANANANANAKSASGSMGAEDVASQMKDEDAEHHAQPMLFQPGVDELEEDEELEYDSSAYILLHQLKMEWPCLSFDFVKDALGQERVKLPGTAFVVAGTQADKPGNNKIFVMKMSEMHRTRREEEDEDEDDKDDDADIEEDVRDENAKIEHRWIKHTGAVNRIRCMPQNPNIVASWSDTGRVFLWDLSPQLISLGALPKKIVTSETVPGRGQTSFFSHREHKDEGYAMGWSPCRAGRFATGDCKGEIHLWDVDASGKCSVESQPLKDHQGSVEDIQWSPTEDTVFASCSVDRTVRIWDTRSKAKAMIKVTAHETDVNVIAWNKKIPYLLASGSDDGSFKIWDLRVLKKSLQGTNDQKPVGFFMWHKGPITSLEWHPHDESVIAAAGTDNQVSIWDCSLEDDPEQANLAPKLQSHIVAANGEKLEIPPQLLFLHQGQKDIKEIHFHPQIPGLISSTAADGFHSFICEPLDPKGISNQFLVSPKSSFS